ncbi:MAG: GNAT family N-acetyltransferase [Smithellaceae bacterium]
MHLIIEPMHLEEVALAVEWAAREGWNPGIHDAACFYAADPKGFFLARLNGEPVGCLSAVAYDERFAFAGFYIVKSEYRTSGIGRALVEKALAYVGNRIIGNDAVVAQQETYKKLGFVPAYRNIRFQGTATRRVGRPSGIVELPAIPFDDLLTYDRKLFWAGRAAFLKCWIAQPEGAALGYVKNGKLTGYGVIRKCRQGYKIGPLFADHEETAETLFKALTGTISGEEFFLDIPEPNPRARRLVQRHAMEKVFETARMYRGAAPTLPLTDIYGVTSFELG